MAYRNNVQRLCDVSDSPNPIREEDLLIAKMNFWHSGHIQHTILATDMNRGGRLFLEALVDFSDGGSRDRGRTSELHLTKPLKALAELYFAVFNLVQNVPVRVKDAPALQHKLGKLDVQK